MNIHLLVLNPGNGWILWGFWGLMEWDDEITSDDWDHSRKFPAFSTSKFSDSPRATQRVPEPTPNKGAALSASDFTCDHDAKH